MPPEVVDRIRRLVHVSRHEPHRQDEGHDGQGQREEEDRPPPEVLEQQTGEQRTEGGDRATQRRPERDRLGACRPRPERRDQREGRRVRHAGREPAEESGDEQDPVGRGVRGEQARRDRERRADDQHELAPVPVPQRTEVEHRCGEAERIAHGDQVQGRLRRVERRADRRQRDVGDGQVQVRDRRDQDQREQDQPAAFRCRGRADRARRRRGRAGVAHGPPSGASFTASGRRTRSGGTRGLPVGPGPGSPDAHDLAERGDQEQLTDDHLHDGERLTRLARGHQIAVPGRRQGGEAEEDVLAHRPRPARAEERSRLQGTEEAVDERERQPDQQIRRDRAQHRFEIDDPAHDQMPDDGERGHHVERAADEEDRRQRPTSSFAQDQIEHRDGSGRDQQDVRRQPNRPSRVRRPEREPHRDDLHHEHDGCRPTSSERDRHPVRDDDQQEDHAVAVRRDEREEQAADHPGVLPGVSTRGPGLHGASFLFHGGSLCG